jgi:hypothetical protein
MVPLVIFIVYKIIYDNHMNKVLKSEGGSTPRKWIAPWLLFVIVFMAQMILYSTGAVALAAFSLHTTTDREVSTISDTPRMNIQTSDSVTFEVDDSYEKIDEGKTDDVDYCLYKKVTTETGCKYILVVHYEAEGGTETTINCDYRTDLNGVSEKTQELILPKNANMCAMADITDVAYNPGKITFELIRGELKTVVIFEV